MGLYKTEDGGENWTNLTAQSNVLPDQDPISLARDPIVPGVIYLGDISTGIYKTWDGGQNWFNTSSGFPAENLARIERIVIDPNETNTLYLAGQFDRSTRIIQGNNGGENWRQEFADLDRGEQITGLQVHPFNSNILYATSTSRAFLESRDKGLSWRALHWFSQEPLTMAVNQNNPQVAFVGTSRGVLRTQDGGNNWENLWEEDETEDDRERVRRKRAFVVKISPLNSNIVLAGTNDGAFVSFDSGNNWQRITRTFPVEVPRIEVITFHPTNPNAFYMAIEDSLYITFSFGQSWDVKKLDLVPDITNIVIDPSNDQNIYLTLSGS